MVPEGEETRKAVLDSIQLGYRHIDTAHAYQNERSVGTAVKMRGIPREEIWITTKLWSSEYGESKTNVQIILRWHITSFSQSLQIRSIFRTISIFSILN